MLSIFNLALQLKLCTSSKSQDVKWNPSHFVAITEKKNQVKLLDYAITGKTADEGVMEYLKEERRLREEREREAWPMKEERRLRAFLDLDRKKKDFMKQWEARPSLCCPRAAYQWERQAWEKAGFNVKLEEVKKLDEAWLNDYEAWLKEEEKKYFVPLPLGFTDWYK